jgi:hypothetical protein
MAVSLRRLFSSSDGRITSILQPPGKAKDPKKQDAIFAGINDAENPPTEHLASASRSAQTLALNNLERQHEESSSSGSGNSNTVSDNSSAGSPAKRGLRGFFQKRKQAREAKREQLPEHINRAELPLKAGHARQYLIQSLKKEKSAELNLWKEMAEVRVGVVKVLPATPENAGSKTDHWGHQKQLETKLITKTEEEHTVYMICMEMLTTEKRNKAELLDAREDISEEIDRLAEENGGGYDSPGMIRLSLELKTNTKMVTSVQEKITKLLQIMDDIEDSAKKSEPAVFQPVETEIQDAAKQLESLTHSWDISASNMQIHTPHQNARGSSLRRKHTDQFEPGVVRPTARGEKDLLAPAQPDRIEIALNAALAQFANYDETDRTVFAKKEELNAYIKAHTHLDPAHQSVVQAQRSFDLLCAEWEQRMNSKLRRISASFEDALLASLNQQMARKDTTTDEKIADCNEELADIQSALPRGKKMLDNLLGQVPAGVEVPPGIKLLSRVLRATKRIEPVLASTRELLESLALEKTPAQPYVSLKVEHVSGDTIFTDIQLHGDPAEKTAVDSAQPLIEDAAPTPAQSSSTTGNELVAQVESSAVAALPRSPTRLQSSTLESAQSVEELLDYHEKREILIKGKLEELDAYIKAHTHSNPSDPFLVQARRSFELYATEWEHHLDSRLTLSTAALEDGVWIDLNQKLADKGTTTETKIAYCTEELANIQKLKTDCQKGLAALSGSETPDTELLSRTLGVAERLEHTLVSTLLLLKSLALEKPPAKPYVSLKIERVAGNIVVTHIEQCIAPGTTHPSAIAEKTEATAQPVVLIKESLQNPSLLVLALAAWFAQKIAPIPGTPHEESSLTTDSDSINLNVPPTPAVSPTPSHNSPEPKHRPVTPTSPNKTPSVAAAVAAAQGGVPHKTPSQPVRKPSKWGIPVTSSLDRPMTQATALEQSEKRQALSVALSNKSKEQPALSDTIKSDGPRIPALSPTPSPDSPEPKHRPVTPTSPNKTPSVAAAVAAAQGGVPPKTPSQPVRKPSKWGTPVTSSLGRPMTPATALELREKRQALRVATSNKLNLSVKKRIR